MGMIMNVFFVFCSNYWVYQFEYHQLVYYIILYIYIYYDIYILIYIYICILSIATNATWAKLTAP
jgi:hypothetical protein